MKILFAAPENAWGGILDTLRTELPGHRFEATGGFHIKSLADTDVLIPTMCPVTAQILADAHRLKLIQQCGAGLDVFWEEPPDPSDPIFACNVMATPHIGGVTDVSMRGIVKVVAENIRRVANNERPLYFKRPEGRA